MIEKRKVFSKGFRIFEVENKYEISILAKSITKPAPRVKNLLEPFSKLSLKYPVLNAKDFWNTYSNPKAHVISFNSSLNPAGASANDSKIPFMKLISGCWYPIKSPSLYVATGDGTRSLLSSKLKLKTSFYIFFL